MFELFATDWRELWGTTPGDGGGVGAVYTKPEIVSLILDLAGYVPARGPLADIRLLEPSCGDGAFVIAAVDRLVASEKAKTAGLVWTDKRLETAIVATDLEEAAVLRCRERIEGLLSTHGCPKRIRTALARSWVIQTDFLLHDFQSARFDCVVGNPPYVRLEGLPKAVLGEYRIRFATLRDRADLYVAFFERGLGLLADAGVLSFICANRFAKNQYGSALRRLIAEDFRVRHYINLEHTQPFETNVSAYPAIVSIDRLKGGATVAGTLLDLDPATLAAAGHSLAGRPAQGSSLRSFDTWHPDGAPWISVAVGPNAELLGELRAEHVPTEDSAEDTRVGIGVATGADEVFVLRTASPEIESDRQIPLLLASDVRAPVAAWSGSVLVNPFASDDDGSLVDLREYPGLRDYFERHSERLVRRHVSRMRPSKWYRTIDRIWPKLTTTDKLVIPDIQLGGVVGFDAGRTYPHHNLYWITSSSWNLPALQTLLRSSIVLAQVNAFSVQMRGGSVRYQAQTLRRVRLPLLRSLASDLLSRLAASALSTNQAQIDELACEAFGIAWRAVRAA